MLRRSLLFISLCLSLSATGQGPYAPAAGQPGTSAIHKDSAVFVDWAFGCSVDRGYLDIADKAQGHATAGTDFNATAAADGLTVSLGDSGIAVVSFLFPILNGPGWDFAIFENSFSDNFLELAQVLVSSNGVDFTAFPAHSLTPDTADIGGFGSTDPTNINNLAGKYRGQYGTPFDLDDLPSSPNLNINNITEIMMIDVTGTVDSNFSIVDTAGNKIVDPYPTVFPSGGFDLDAVGVIHSTKPSGIKDLVKDVEVYPNPTSDYLFVRISETFTYEIMDVTGKKIRSGLVFASGKIDVSDITEGMYVMQLFNENTTARAIFIKK